MIATGTNRPEATPSKSRAILNVAGKPCRGATAADYPLYGTCDHCGEPIRCADGTADWAHIGTGNVRCAPACPECGGPVVFDSGLYHCDEGGHGAWDPEYVR